MFTSRQMTCVMSLNRRRTVVNAGSQRVLSTLSNVSFLTSSVIDFIHDTTYVYSSRFFTFICDNSRHKTVKSDALGVN